MTIWDFANAHPYVICFVTFLAALSIETASGNIARAWRK